MKIKKTSSILFSAIYLQVNVAWCGVPTLEIPTRIHSFSSSLFSVSNKVLPTINALPALNFWNGFSGVFTTSFINRRMASSKKFDNEVFVFHQSWQDAWLPEYLRNPKQEEYKGPLRAQENVDNGIQNHLDSNGGTQILSGVDKIQSSQIEQKANTVLKNPETALSALNFNVQPSASELSHAIDTLKADKKDVTILQHTSGQVEILVRTPDKGAADITFSVSGTGLVTATLKTVTTDKLEATPNTQIANQQKPTQESAVPLKPVSDQQTRINQTQMVKETPITNQNLALVGFKGNPADIITVKSEDAKMVSNSLTTRFEGKITWTTKEGLRYEATSLNGAVQLKVTAFQDKAVMSEYAQGRLVSKTSFDKAGDNITIKGNEIIRFEGNSDKGITREVFAVAQQAAGTESKQLNVSDKVDLAASRGQLVVRQSDIDTTFKMVGDKITMVKIASAQGQVLAEVNRDGLMQSNVEFKHGGIEKVFQVVSGPKFDAQTGAAHVDINVVTKTGDTRVLPTNLGKAQSQGAQSEINLNQLDKDVHFDVLPNGSILKKADSDHSLMAATMTLDGKTQQVASTLKDNVSYFVTTKNAVGQLASVKVAESLDGVKTVNFISKGNEQNVRGTTVVMLTKDATPAAIVGIQKAGAAIVVPHVEGAKLVDGLSTIKDGKLSSSISAFETPTGQTFDVHFQNNQTVVSFYHDAGSKEGSFNVMNQTLTIPVNSPGVKYNLTEGKFEVDSTTVQNFNGVTISNDLGKFQLKFNPATEKIDVEMKGISANTSFAGQSLGLKQETNKPVFADGKLFVELKEGSQIEKAKINFGGSSSITSSNIAAKFISSDLTGLKTISSEVAIAQTVYLPSQTGETTDSNKKGLRDNTTPGASSTNLKLETVNNVTKVSPDGFFSQSKMASLLTEAGVTQNGTALLQGKANLFAAGSDNLAAGPKGFEVAGLKLQSGQTLSIGQNLDMKVTSGIGSSVILGNDGSRIEMKSLSTVLFNQSGGLKDVIQGGATYKSGDKFDLAIPGAKNINPEGLSGRVLESRVVEFAAGQTPKVISEGKVEWKATSDVHVDLKLGASLDIAKGTTLQTSLPSLSLIASGQVDKTSVDGHVLVKGADRLDQTTLPEGLTGSVQTRFQLEISGNNKKEVTNQVLAFSTVNGASRLADDGSGILVAPQSRFTANNTQFEGLDMQRGSFSMLGARKGEVQSVDGKSARVVQQSELKFSAGDARPTFTPAKIEGEAGSKWTTAINLPNGDKGERTISFGQKETVVVGLSRVEFDSSVQNGKLTVTDVTTAFSGKRSVTTVLERSLGDNGLIKETSSKEVKQAFSDGREISYSDKTGFDLKNAGTTQNIERSNDGHIISFDLINPTATPLAPQVELIGYTFKANDFAQGASAESLLRITSDKGENHIFVQGINGSISSRENNISFSFLGQKVISDASGHVETIQDKSSIGKAVVAFNSEGIRTGVVAYAPTGMVTAKGGNGVTESIFVGSDVLTIQSQSMGANGKSQDTFSLTFSQKGSNSFYIKEGSEIVQSKGQLSLSHGALVAKDKGDEIHVGVPQMVNIPEGGVGSSSGPNEKVKGKEDSKGNFTVTEGTVLVETNSKTGESALKFKAMTVFENTTIADGRLEKIKVLTPKAHQSGSEFVFAIQVEAPASFSKTKTLTSKEAAEVSALVQEKLNVSTLAKPSDYSSKEKKPISIFVLSPSSDRLGQVRVTPEEASIIIKDGTGTNSFSRQLGAGLLTLRGGTFETEAVKVKTETFINSKDMDKVEVTVSNSTLFKLNADKENNNPVYVQTESRTETKEVNGIKQVTNKISRSEDFNKTQYSESRPIVSKLGDIVGRVTETFSFENNKGQQSIEKETRNASGEPVMKQTMVTQKGKTLEPTVQIWDKSKNKWSEAVADPEYFKEVQMAFYGLNIPGFTMNESNLGTFNAGVSFVGALALSLVSGGQSLTAWGLTFAVGSAGAAGLGAYAGVETIYQGGSLREGILTTALGFVPMRVGMLGNLGKTAVTSALVAKETSMVGNALRYAEVAKAITGIGLTNPMARVSAELAMFNLVNDVSAKFMGDKEVGVGTVLMDVVSVGLPSIAFGLTKIGGLVSEISFVKSVSQILSKVPLLNTSIEGMGAARALLNNSYVGSGLVGGLSAVFAVGVYNLSHGKDFSSGFGETFTVFLAGASLGVYSSIIARNFKNVLAFGRAPEAYYKLAFNSAIGWAGFGLTGVGSLLPSYDVGHIDPETGKAVKGNGWTWEPKTIFNRLPILSIREAVTMFREGLVMGPLLSALGFNPKTGSVASQVHEKQVTGVISEAMGLNKLLNREVSSLKDKILLTGRSMAVAGGIGGSSTLVYDFAAKGKVDWNDVVNGTLSGVVLGGVLAPVAIMVGGVLPTPKDGQRYIFSWTQGVNSVVSSAKFLPTPVAHLAVTFLAGAEGVIPFHALSQAGSYLGYEVGQSLGLSNEQSIKSAGFFSNVAMFFAPMPDFAKSFLTVGVEAKSTRAVSAIVEALGRLNAAPAEVASPEKLKTSESDPSLPDSKTERKGQNDKVGEQALVVNFAGLKIELNPKSGKVELDSRSGSDEILIKNALVQTRDLILENSPVLQAVQNLSYSDAQLSKEGFVRVGNIDSSLASHPLKDLVVTTQVKELILDGVSKALEAQNVHPLIIANSEGKQINGFTVDRKLALTALNRHMQSLEMPGVTQLLANLPALALSGGASGIKLYMQDGRIKIDGPNVIGDLALDRSRPAVVLKIDKADVRDAASGRLVGMVTDGAIANSKVLLAYAINKVEFLLKNDTSMPQVQKDFFSAMLESLHAGDVSVVLPVLMTEYVDSSFKSNFIAQSAFGSIKDTFSKLGVRVDGIEGYKNVVQSRESRVAEIKERGGEVFKGLVDLMAGKNAGSLIYHAEMGNAEQVESLLKEGGVGHQEILKLMDSHLPSLGVEISNGGNFMKGGRVTLASGGRLESALKEVLQEKFDGNNSIKALISKEYGRKIMDALAGGSTSKLSFEDQFVLAFFAERVFYENATESKAVTANGWDGTKAIGQVAFVLNGLSGRISSLSTGAGKSAGFALVFGINNLRGKMDVGEYLVALKQDAAAFIRDYKELGNAFGINFVNGSDLYAKPQPDFAGLTQAYQGKGKGTVVVMDLDSRGFVELTSRTSHPELDKALNNANIRGIDESDVAALSQKAFRMAQASNDAAGFASKDLVKTVGEMTDQISSLKTEFLDKAKQGGNENAWAYHVEDGKRVDLSNGFFDFLVEKGVIKAEEKEKATEGQAVISNVIRAISNIETKGETGDFYATSNGTVSKVKFESHENGVRMEGTSDGSNFFNVAIALVHMKSVTGAEKVMDVVSGKAKKGLDAMNLDPKKIEISRGFGEATLSRIFSRRSLTSDVLNFGGSATLDVAREIASMIYGSEAVELQGSSISQYGLGDGKRKLQVSELGSANVPHLIENLMKNGRNGLLLLNTSAEGRRQNIIDAVKTLYGNRNRAAYTNEKAEKFRGEKAISEWLKDNSGRIQKMSNVEFLETMAAEILINNKGEKIGDKIKDISLNKENIQNLSPEELELRIVNRANNLEVDVIEGGTDSNIVSLLASYTAGRIVVGNERAGRALNFSNERVTSLAFENGQRKVSGELNGGVVHQILIGFESKTIGEVLQALGRVGRNSASRFTAQRYMLVDSEKMASTYNRTVQLDSELKTKTNGERQIFDSKAQKEKSGEANSVQTKLEGFQAELNKSGSSGFSEYFSSRLLGLVEVVTQFNAVQAKSWSILFKMGTETHSILVKDPLSSMSQLADINKSDKALLERKYQASIEHSEKSNLKPAEGFQHPEQMARDSFRQTLEDAKMVWGELKEKLSDPKLKSMAEQRYNDVTSVLDHYELNFQKALEASSQRSARGESIRKTFADVATHERTGVASSLLDVVAELSRLIIPGVGEAPTNATVKNAPSKISEVESAAKNRVRGSPEEAKKTVESIVEEIKSNSTLSDAKENLTLKGRVVAAAAIQLSGFSEAQTAALLNQASFVGLSAIETPNFVGWVSSFVTSVANTFYGGDISKVEMPLVMSLLSDSNALFSNNNGFSQEEFKSILFSENPFEALSTFIATADSDRLNPSFNRAEWARRTDSIRKQNDDQEKYFFGNMVQKADGSRDISTWGKFKLVLTGTHPAFPWSGAANVQKLKNPSLSDVFNKFSNGNADVAKALSLVLLKTQVLGDSSSSKEFAKGRVLTNPKSAEFLNTVFANPTQRKLDQVKLGDLLSVLQNPTRTSQAEFDDKATQPFPLTSKPWFKPSVAVVGLGVGSAVAVATVGLTSGVGFGLGLAVLSSLYLTKSTPTKALIGGAVGLGIATFGLPALASATGWGVVAYLASHAPIGIPAMIGTLTSNSVLLLADKPFNALAEKFSSKNEVRENAVRVLSANKTASEIKKQISNEIDSEILNAAKPEEKKSIESSKKSANEMMKKFSGKLGGDSSDLFDFSSGDVKSEVQARAKIEGQSVSRLIKAIEAKISDPELRVENLKSLLSLYGVSDEKTESIVALYQKASKGTDQQSKDLWNALLKKEVSSLKEDWMTPELALLANNYESSLGESDITPESISNYVDELVSFDLTDSARTELKNNLVSFYAGETLTSENRADINEWLAFRSQLPQDVVSSQDSSNGIQKSSRTNTIKAAWDNVKGIDVPLQRANAVELTRPGSPVAQAVKRVAETQQETLKSMSQVLSEAGIPVPLVKQFVTSVVKSSRFDSSNVSEGSIQHSLNNMGLALSPTLGENIVGALTQKYFSESYIGFEAIHNNLTDSDVHLLSAVAGVDLFSESGLTWADRRPVYQALTMFGLSGDVSISRPAAHGDWVVSRQTKNESGALVTTPVAIVRSQSVEQNGNRSVQVFLYTNKVSRSFKPDLVLSWNGQNQLVDVRTEGNRKRITDTAGSPLTVPLVSLPEGTQFKVRLQGSRAAASREVVLVTPMHQQSFDVFGLPSDLVDYSHVFDRKEPVPQAEAPQAVTEAAPVAQEEAVKPVTPPTWESRFQSEEPVSFFNSVISFIKGNHQFSDDQKATPEFAAQFNAIKARVLEGALDSLPTAPINTDKQEFNVAVLSHPDGSFFGIFVRTMTDDGVVQWKGIDNIGGIEWAPPVKEVTYSFTEFYHWDGKTLYKQVDSKSNKDSDDQTPSAPQKRSEPSVFARIGILISGILPRAAFSRFLSVLAISAVSLIPISSNASPVQQVGARSVNAVAAADPLIGTVARAGAAVVSVNTIFQKTADVVLEKDSFLRISSVETTTNPNILSVHLEDGRAMKLDVTDLRQSPAVSNSSVETIFARIIRVQGDSLKIEQGRPFHQLSILGGSDQVASRILVALSAIEIRNPEASLLSNKEVKAVEKVLSDQTMGPRAQTIQVLPLLTGQKKADAQALQVKTLGDVLKLDSSHAEFKAFVYKTILENAEAMSSENGTLVSANATLKVSREFGGAQVLLEHSHPDVETPNASFQDHLTAYRFQLFAQRHGFKFADIFSVVRGRDGVLSFFDPSKNLITVNRSGKEVKASLANTRSVVKPVSFVSATENQQASTISNLLSLLTQAFSGESLPQSATHQFFGGDNRAFADKSFKLATKIGGAESGVSLEVQSHVWKAVGYRAIDPKFDVKAYLEKFAPSALSLEPLIQEMANEMAQKPFSAPMNFARQQLMPIAGLTIHQFLNIAAWPQDEVYVLGQINKILDLRLIDGKRAKVELDAVNARLKSADINQVINPLLIKTGLYRQDLVKDSRGILALGKVLKSKGVWKSSSDIEAALRTANNDNESLAIALQLLVPSFMQELSELTGLREYSLPSNFDVRVVKKSQLNQGITGRKAGVIVEKGIIEIGVDENMTQEDVLLAVGELMHELTHAFADRLGLKNKNSAANEAIVAKLTSETLRRAKLDVIADILDRATFQAIVDQSSNLLAQELKTLDVTVSYISFADAKLKKDELLAAAKGLGKLKRIVIVPENESELSEANSLFNAAQFTVANISTLGGVKSYKGETKLEAHARLNFGTRRVRVLSNVKSAADLNDNWRSLIQLSNGEIPDVLFVSLATNQLASVLEQEVIARLIKVQA